MNKIVEPRAHVSRQLGFAVSLVVLRLRKRALLGKRVLKAQAHVL